MAFMADRDELLLDVEGLRATVETLTMNVMTLTTHVAGLMASHDGGVYGEAYADDTGPAVRATFFETVARDTEEHGRRTLFLTDQFEGLEGLEGTLAEMATIQTNYNDAVDRMVASTNKLEDEMKDVRVSRVPADRKDKTYATGMKGFEKMMIYTGEASLWPDWRFKMTTWLSQTNPSFETLMTKLDQSEIEPKEP